MLELRVLNGLHRGAALPVMEGHTSIGAGDDCDIVLLDPGIADRECVLVRHGDLVWLHSLGDGCRSANGDAIHGAKRVRERRAFQIGELWLMICDESAPWPRRVPSPRYTSRAGRAPMRQAGGPTNPRPEGRVRGLSALRGIVRPIFGAIALLGFGAIAANVPALFSGSAQAVVPLPAVPDRWTASAALARPDTQPIVRAISELPPGGSDESTGQGRTDAGGAVPSGLAGSADPPFADDRERQLQALEDARDLLERMLRDAELDTRLQLSESDGAWQLRGAIDSEEQLRATRVIARWRRQVPDAPPVTLRQVSQAELLPFKVDSVMTGPSASVTIGAGRRLYVGDAMAGWKLVSIDSAKVVFQGQRRVEIDW